MQLSEENVLNFCILPYNLSIIFHLDNLWKSICRSNNWLFANTIYAMEIHVETELLHHEIFINKVLEYKKHIKPTRNINQRRLYCIEILKKLQLMDIENNIPTLSDIIHRNLIIIDPIVQYVDHKTYIANKI